MICIRGPKETKGYQAKGIRKNQQTFRNDCQARLKLTYHKRQNCLQVVSVHLSHNHRLSDIVYKHYPAERRLDREQTERAKELLAIGTSASSITSALRLETKKEIRHKDIHNIKTKFDRLARNNKSEEQVLANVINEAKKTDPHLIVEYKMDNRTRNLEVLLFMTKRMQESFQKFPELLFMDGTYNLTAERYPLYVIAVQDNSGYTRPVAVAFVGQDTSANLREVLRLFKSCHESILLERTRIVFIDKDKKEINALKFELPGAALLLCWFHVIKAMKSAVADLDVVKSEKERIFQALQRIIHSYDETAYQKNIHYLAQCCSNEFYAYFIKNWDSCKEKWVFYIRKHLPTLGNQTTNRVEALNRAIKAVFRAVQRTSMTFSKAVQTLLKFLVLTDVSVTYNEFLNIEKTPYVNDKTYGDILTKAGKSLTGQALRLLLAQLNKLGDEKDDYDIEILGDAEFVVRNRATSSNYCLHLEGSTKYGTEEKAEMMTCSCFFSCTFGLPCRHIMHCRHILETKTLTFDDCAHRWHRSFTGPDIEFLRSNICEMAAQHVGLDDETNQFEEIVRHHPMSKERRFNKAFSIAKEIASVISEYGGAAFNDRISLLRTLLTALERQINAKVVEECIRSGFQKYTQLDDEKTQDMAAERDNNPAYWTAVELTESARKETDSDWESVEITEKDAASLSQPKNNTTVLPFKIARIPIKSPGRPKKQRKKISFGKNTDRDSPGTSEKSHRTNGQLVGPPQSQSLLSTASRKQEESSIGISVELEATPLPVSGQSHKDYESTSYGYVSTTNPSVKLEDVLPLLKLFFLSERVDAVARLYSVKKTIQSLDGFLKLADLLPTVPKTVREQRNFFQTFRFYNIIHHEAMTGLYNQLHRELSETQATKTCYWCRPAGVLLGWYHRHLITSTEKPGAGWLDSTICFAASSMMKQQYTQYLGLEHPDTFKIPVNLVAQAIHNLRVRNFIETKPPKVSAVAEPRVQILNLGGEHWITMKGNCDNLQPWVLVYDSLHMGVNEFLATQIASVMRYPAQCKFFCTSSPDVCRQKNHSDCGLFAIAFALAACQNRNPENLTLASTETIRMYLTTSLEQGYFTEDGFPTVVNRGRQRKKRISCAEIKKSSWTIHCRCRMPVLPKSANQSKEKETILKCGTGKSCSIQTYHESCVLVFDTTYKASTYTDSANVWVCPTCVLKRKENEGMETMSLLFDGLEEPLREKWRAWTEHAEPFTPERGLLRLNDISQNIVTRIEGTKTTFISRLNSIPSKLLQIIHWTAWQAICNILQISQTDVTEASKQVSWIYGADIFLPYSQRILVIEGAWLHDDLINVAQYLLRQQMHTTPLSGLLPVGSYTFTGGDLTAPVNLDTIRAVRHLSLDSAELLSVGHKERRIQILHIGGCHWVTVSNILSESPNIVYCYDTRETLMRAPYFAHLVAMVFRFSDYDEMELVWPEVAYQPNSNDCGVYAIAISQLLTQQKDPCTVTFENKVMRASLVQFLEEQYIGEFKNQKEQGLTQNKIRVSSDEAILCSCRMPLFVSQSGEKEKTILCANGKNCKIKKFHLSCLQFVDLEKEWTCTDCKKALQQ